MGHEPGYDRALAPELRARCEAGTIITVEELPRLERYE